MTFLHYLGWNKIIQVFDVNADAIVSVGVNKAF